MDPPKHYREIAGRDDAASWYDTINVEMDDLEALKFADLISRPPGVRGIQSRLIFERKVTGDKRCRLVAMDRRVKGQERVHSPVATDDSFRLFIAKCAEEDLFDVRKAYLIAEMEGIVYLEQPEGAVSHVRNKILINQSSVLNVIGTMTTIKEARLITFSYILQGNQNEPNNFDDFHWMLTMPFTALKLFEMKGDVLCVSKDCSILMILQNISAPLHVLFRSCSSVLLTYGIIYWLFTLHQRQTLRPCCYHQ
jgi:hypothetical protein